MLLAFSCQKEPVDKEILDTKSAVGSVAEEAKDAFFVSEAMASAYIKEVFKEKNITSLKVISSERDPLMYVVNFEQGWKIVSADKRMPPVLAFSGSGQFDEAWEDNPGTKAWVNSAKRAITKVKTDEAANTNTVLWDMKSAVAVKDNERIAASPYRKFSEILWTKIALEETTTETQSNLLGPYTETTWGQGSPWNNIFPIDYYAQTYFGETIRYATGCVSVALSQLFYYYHFKVGQPSGLYTLLEVGSQTPADTIGVLHSITGGTVYVRGVKLNLNRDNYEDPTSRWSQMAKSKTSGGNTSYVSDLMLDAGCRANTSYSGLVGSGALLQDAYNAFTHFGLQASMGPFQKDIVLNNLIMEQPVFVGGYDFSGAGHAWVLDGYYKSTVAKKTKYKWVLGYSSQEGIGVPATADEAVSAAEMMGMDKPEDPMWTEENVYKSYDYYHMNWGWDGERDGFFLMFFPGLDDNRPTIDYGHNVQIIYNITPAQ